MAEGTMTATNLKHWAVKDGDDIWHALDPKREFRQAEWAPILCGGGISKPTFTEAHEPTCTDCLERRSMYPHPVLTFIDDAHDHDAIIVGSCSMGCQVPQEGDSVREVKMAGQSFRLCPRCWRRFLEDQKDILSWAGEM